MLRHAAERGDIPGDLDLDRVITMLMLIADGLWWRRALEPNFEPATMIPTYMDVVRHLLRARPKALRDQNDDQQRATVESSP